MRGVFTQIKKTKQISYYNHLTCIVDDLLVFKSICFSYTGSWIPASPINQWIGVIWNYEYVDIFAISTRGKHIQL